MANESASGSLWAWSVTEVVAWAREEKMEADIVLSIKRNKVDGKALLSMTQSDLHSTFGVASLLEKERLWNLVKSLKSSLVTEDDFDSRQNPGSSNGIVSMTSLESKSESGITVENMGQSIAPIYDSSISFVSNVNRKHSSLKLHRPVYARRWK